MAAIANNKRYSSLPNRLDCICEEESDEDSDEEIEEEIGFDEANDHGRFGAVSSSDYLQAFSHFTYKYTGRKLVVCDLQGVYNNETVPLMFELTDPAIHYLSGSGRRMVF